MLEKPRFVLDRRKDLRYFKACLLFGNVLRFPAPASLILGYIKSYQGD